MTRLLALRVALVAAVLGGPAAAAADVYRPAYLELSQRDGETYDVVWRVPARGDRRLAVHVRFPEGTIEVSPPRATLDAGAVTERWTIRREGGLAGEEIRIAGLPAGITDVLARVERLDGTTQVQRLVPARPHFVVEGTQHGASVSLTYLRLGFQHILEGIDHLLFVAALMLIVGSVPRLIGTITAFTLAHSLTLAAATLGLVTVAQAPVEAAIALSIVFVAAEIVHGLQGRPGLTARAPWIVAFGFGLLHGLGFAGALSEVGLPEQAIPLALLFFNIGVELGQLVFVAVVWTAVVVLRRTPTSVPAWAPALPAYAIGTIAMFWVIERTLAFVP